MSGCTSNNVVLEWGCLRYKGGKERCKPCASCPLGLVLRDTQSGEKVGLWVSAENEFHSNNTYEIEQMMHHLNKSSPILINTNYTYSSEALGSLIATSSLRYG